MVQGQPNSRLVEDLDKSSRFLRCHNFFWKFQRAKDTKVIYIYETKPTPTAEVRSLSSGELMPMATDNSQEISGWRRTGPAVLMVTRDSAIHPTPENQEDILSIDADHSEIVKFGNKACPDYNNIRSRVIRLVQNGQTIIKKRFECQHDGMSGMHHDFRLKGAHSYTRNVESRKWG